MQEFFYEFNIFQKLVLFNCCKYALNFKHCERKRIFKILKVKLTKYTVITFIRIKNLIADISEQSQFGRKWCPHARQRREILNCIFQSVINQRIFFYIYNFKNASREYRTNASKEKLRISLGGISRFLRKLSSKTKRNTCCFKKEN